MGDNSKNKDSLVIRLETLRKEYDIVLNQYQEAQQTYINNLKNPPTNESEYTVLDSRLWMGTGRLDAGIVNTESECWDMCAKNPECSGAVFNNSNSYCFTRSGDSGLIASPSGDMLSAILPTLKANNIVLQSLNDRLVQLTEQINEEIKKLSPTVLKIDTQKTYQQDILTNTYTKLLDEKKKLQDDIMEYDTLNHTNSNYEIELHQENMMYRIWVLITIIVIIFLISQLFGLEHSMGIIKILVTIAFLFILSYSLKSPIGILIWGLIIISILFALFGN